MTAEGAQGRDPALLKEAMKHVTWSVFPSPTFTETEDLFVQAAEGYIQTSFPPETPVESIYPALVQEDLTTEIGSQPEPVQNEIKHVLYIATEGAKVHVTPVPNP